MPEPLRLRVVLQPRGPAGAIVLDEDQAGRLGGGGKAFPVTVEVGGRTARLRLARMGGEPLVGFSRAVREELGVELGDELDVVVARDDAPREVELPPELAEALAADDAARAAFDALAPSHRKEHARAVAEAKQPATRQRRVERVLDALRGRPA